MTAAATCPNCGKPAAGHATSNSSCILAVFASLISDRGTLTPDALTELIDTCWIDSLWDDLGPIIDNFEKGRYS